jgi:drug/metabolite transporter (DMT)-like permease
MTARPRPELVLVGVTLLWGSTFIVTKSVVREAAPLPYLMLRFGLAAAALAIVYRRLLPAARRALVDGAVLGALNTVGLLFQVLGQVYTTASKSSFITSLNTPLTPVVGYLVYRTRPSPAQLVAVVMASLGVALLTYPTGGARWNPGDLLTLGCAVTYAFTIVEMARRSARHDTRALTLVLVAASALLITALYLTALAARALMPLALQPEVLRLEARPFLVDAKLAIEIAYMALVCTALTLTAQLWAMGRMSATHAAVVFALEPVFATAIAVGVDGSAEWPGARGAAGAAVVMMAVLVSEIRLPPRRL